MDVPDAPLIYDELAGPDLDPARWAPVRLPLPGGGEHIPLDPSAEITVGDGEVRVTIPRFSLSHDTIQSADSVKLAIFSTREFDVPPDRPATFAADMAVEILDGEPSDYRRGIATFAVAAADPSRRVFSVGGTSTRVLAMHEQLSPSGPGAPFVYVTESPYSDFDDDFTRLRACDVSLDRSSSSATWRVDGRTIYEARGIAVPERVRLAFGIFTMLPIRAGRSQSLHGQGLDARWGAFRVHGVGVR